MCIPRLEPVRTILQSQEHNYDGSGAPSTSPSGPALPLGARVLKIVSDWDSLEVAGMEPGLAAETMRGRRGRYDPKLLETFVRMNVNVALRGVQPMSLASLKPGMSLAQDVLSSDGRLLVVRGQEVTLGLLRRLRNLSPGSVREPIHVVTASEQPGRDYN